jgi:IS4 transposase
MLVPDQTTVGDCLYGRDYQLFAQIQQTGAFFVFRISNSAVIEVDEELPVTAAEQAVGVVSHAWVYLGATKKLRSMRLRLVEVKKYGQHLFIFTNHPVQTVSAELVSLIYRRRWSIELFFGWIKCILGCRHFLAESLMTLDEKGGIEFEEKGIG